ncbi:DUF6726 family protein [Trichloromonas sp.]|uniref:DUF6726 family protein n=1 Tax=Trichloromonas sp. TaxID=3069249 RepID=UPI003D81739C
MTFIKTLIILLLASQLSGCLFTKLVSVPIRVGGAVLSIVPGAGNSIHDALDTAAETIDDVPI